ANLESSFVGGCAEYLEMPFIHVSSRHRGKGIGEKIFRVMLNTAKKRGAHKIYIASHPSIESQGFYKKLGCELTKEINDEIYNCEPLDIQLECCIKK
ncbi:MAG: GNAT family N-acetyltransferase, partial [Clostridiaceae bacterium]|nr:GNAT family N-acetyltransferase [Clostridiaceae bacterium]